MDPAQGAPPQAIGAVVAWLATFPEADDLDGAYIDAQDFCRTHALYAW